MELWRKNAIDFKTGYSMTVAPLVADGVVIRLRDPLIEPSLDRT
jgi:hypothetical protein